MLLAFVGACNLSDEGEFCDSDFQCEYQCSRVGECLGASGGREVRLNWTISGVAPTPSNPGPCGPIAAFELRFESKSGRDSAVYFPVPCSLGQAYYDKMPERFVTLELWGKDEFGTTIVIESGAIDSASNLLTIDLDP